jgi:hypothetical protein
MNLIEMLLGVSPDGGNGVAEVALGFVLVLLASILAFQVVNHATAARRRA